MEHLATCEVYDTADQRVEVVRAASADTPRWPPGPLLVGCDRRSVTQATIRSPTCVGTQVGPDPPDLVQRRDGRDRQLDVVRVRAGSEASETSEALASSVSHRFRRLMAVVLCSPRGEIGASAPCSHHLLTFV